MIKGSKHSEISRQMMSIKHLGKIISQETILKIVEARKGYRGYKK